jgi:hypothetical protein
MSSDASAPGQLILLEKGRPSSQRARARAGPLDIRRRLGCVFDGARAFPPTVRPPKCVVPDLPPASRASTKRGPGCIPADLEVLRDAAAGLTGMESLKRLVRELWTAYSRYTRRHAAPATGRASLTRPCGAFDAAIPMVTLGATPSGDPNAPPPVIADATAKVRTIAWFRGRYDEFEPVAFSFTHVMIFEQERDHARVDE